MAPLGPCSVWEKYVNECGNSKRRLAFPELSHTDWLCDLEFTLDMLHMNELNVRLQRKDQFA